MSTNNDDLESEMVTWCEGIHLDDDRGKPFEDLFTHNFASLIQGIGEHLHLDSMSRVAFPAEATMEAAEPAPFDILEGDEDVAKQDINEELLSEEVFLDTKTHKTSMPYDFCFGAALGIDPLELKDSVGNRYSVLNMVDLGTTFQ